MTFEQRSKNVQAVLDWVRKNRPGDVHTFEELFDLILIGFEAGRAFEKENPTVESGIGYMPNDMRSGGVTAGSSNNPRAKRRAKKHV